MTTVTMLAIQRRTTTLAALEGKNIGVRAYDNLTSDAREDFPEEHLVKKSPFSVTWALSRALLGFTAPCLSVRLQITVRDLDL